MGTIVTRKRSDGTTAYRADVRIMRDGQQVFKRVRTFDRRRDALEWMLAVEREWEAGQDSGKPPHTVAEMIGRYIDRRDALKPLGRTSRRLLQTIALQPIGALRAADVDERAILLHCEARRAAGAGPATVLQDFAWLQTMYKEARLLLGISVDEMAFKSARPMLVRLGLIAKPTKRKRRLETDELDRLLAAFRLRTKKAATLIPMAEVLEFALYSCMRLGEVCCIQWADLDETRRTVVIRDRKNPQAKKGNDQTVPLLGPAFEIAARQPRDSDRIFPYNPRSVSMAFTQICKQLGIRNLRFHDLRREGATRLLEMGYSVPEVATVTGHKDLNILWQVYTAIQPEHLHNKYDNRA